MEAGPILIEASDPNDRQMIADEFVKHYKQEYGGKDITSTQPKHPYIFQVNCSSLLTFAQGLFAIGLEFDIKEAREARNLKYVTKYVLDYFQNKPDTLFILIDLSELNKFTKQFLKQVKLMPELNILIISQKNEIQKLRVIVANYDLYKVRGIQPIIDKMPQTVRSKYRRDRRIRDHHP